MRVESPQTQLSKTICGIVLLRTDGAALLQHRDNKPGLQAAGQWVFPGGHAEAGEDFQSCALREFEEETTYRCDHPQWLVTLPDCYDPSWEPYRLVIFWDIYDGRQSYSAEKGKGWSLCSEATPIIFQWRSTCAAFGTWHYCAKPCLMDDCNPYRSPSDQILKS